MDEQRVHAVVFRDPETGQWIGRCLEYDVVTQADTREDAFACVRDAVEITLAGASPDDLADAFQPLDGEPEIRTIAIRAPSLLNA